MNISNPTLNDLKLFNWLLPSKVEDLDKLKQKARHVRKVSARALVAKLLLGICTQAQFLRGM